MSVELPPGGASTGACLALLRMEAGLSLRELGSRLGVSSAYLSRVEHGRDPAPTLDRLATFADAIGLPRRSLFELVRGTEATLSALLRDSPAAGQFVTELARSAPTADDIAALRALLSNRVARRTTSSPAEPVEDAGPSSIASLLTPDRVLLGVQCASVSDALDLAVSRLPLGPASPPLELLGGAARASALEIGHGVVLARLVAPGLPLSASLATTSAPLHGEAGPISVAVVLASATRGLVRLAHAATQLARSGVAARLAHSRTPSDVIAAVALLETP